MLWNDFLSQSGSHYSGSVTLFRGTEPLTLARCAATKRFKWNWNWCIFLVWILPLV